MESSDHEQPALDPPTYPAATDTANEAQPPEHPWGARLVIAAVVLAFGVIVLLHLTGILGAGPH